MKKSPTQSDIEENLYRVFAEESRVGLRHTACSLQAEREGYGQLARLLRAAGNAKSVHARRFLYLMRGKIGLSKENVRAALARELITLESDYSRMVTAARKGSTALKKAFVQSMKTNQEQAELLRAALEDMLQGEEIVYYVCQICGHIHRDVVPENCPVCRAVSGRFKKVE